MDLKFILSLMNSTLMNFIYLQKYKSTKKVFSEIQARSIKKLPIPFVSTETQAPFIEKVNKILALKKADAKADTSALEREIDFMVYELYGLSEEEIRIVEGGE
jgi:hypothetical protein